MYKCKANSCWKFQVFTKQVRLFTTQGKNSFENIVEKEEMLVTSNFFFSHNVLYSFSILYLQLFCRMQLFQFGVHVVQNFVVWLWVKQDKL